MRTDLDRIAGIQIGEMIDTASIDESAVAAAEIDEEALAFLIQVDQRVAARFFGPPWR